MLADHEPFEESNRLSDRIYLRLRDQVMTGALEPGQRLVESQIARDFGVSQAPIRDALKRLANDGLIIQPPRRGSFVASVDEAEARRIYKTRELLEPYAAKEFAAVARDVDHELLRTIVQKMHEAAASNDLPRLVDFDVQFHRTIYHGSNHPLLPRIWTSFEHLMRIFTPRSNRLRYNSLSEIADTHVVLLDAIEAAEADRIEKEFVLHVTDVWRRIERDTSDHATTQVP